MAIIQTENHNYYRDTSSGALINNNKDELQLLKAQRVREINRNSEMNLLKQELAELKKLIGAVVNVKE